MNPIDLTPLPPSVQALLRHFDDLLDGNHGGAISREDKERLFQQEVGRLDPVAREVLGELNISLLLGTGTIQFSGLQEEGAGGLMARWTLAWPEQQQAGLPPATLLAFYGRGFHHPHLRGGTVGDWPLNVYTDEQAQEERGILRAIAACEVHNLVFQVGGDIRLIPATRRTRRER